MMLLYKLGFLEVSWVDALDILLVGMLLYQLYKLLRGSIAVKIFVGFLTIYLVFLVVKASGMELLSAILGQFIGVGVIAVLILFQQEIRRFLFLLGKTTAFNNDRFFKNLPWKRAFEPKRPNFSQVLEAIVSLSAYKTGALIIFTKSSELRYYAESGVPVDALISKRLLLSIFNKNSPLHDGAVIITNSRIKAASCIVPVSERDDLPHHFGLRHRAAAGITEVTDAVVVTVSEETGKINLFFEGKYFEDLDKAKVKEYLNIFLMEEAKDSPKETDTPRPSQVKLDFKKGD